MQIALIDSGIGGLTLLKRFINECPSNDYVYFADTYAHPYGKERASALQTRLIHVAEFLYERGAEALVFACNTASTIALDRVQKTAPIPVYGVQPIYEKGDDALIMCTPLTAQSPLVKKYGEEGATIYANPCLAPLVERYYKDLNALEDYLESELKKYRNNSKIILGCTHYVYLKEQIERVTGIKSYDCYDGVINKIGEISRGGGANTVKFIFTGPRKEEEYKEILAKI